MEHKLTPGNLLNEKGHLTEAGYATSLVKTYNRNHIKASSLRIKEWDYYLIHNDQFGIALTIADNSYMSMLSASFLDFQTPTQITVSPIGLFPMGKTNLPPSSAEGTSKLTVGKSTFTFTSQNNIRHLRCHLDNFKDNQPFTCDFTLTEEPRDSMVIATPFPKKATAFYYNQKIIAMRAEGHATFANNTYTFSPHDTFALLDWGRGVWTYNNTWYWGAGQGIVDGHTVGFNIGYGFGDTSAAGENMIFYDGIAHKFEKITFNIPKTADGKDDFLSPWTFTSSDGRFEMDFTPIIDRASRTNVLLIESDQHQVFGNFNGTMILDDGTPIHLHNFLGFAEKVKNRW